MSEEQPIFKVRDRRLFNPDGTPRDVEPREDEAQPATSGAANAPDESVNTDTAAASSETSSPASAAPASSAPAPDAAAATASGETQAAGSATGARQPRNFEAESDPGEDEDALGADDALGVDDPASFVNFLMSIASNAAAALGMMEHPATGQRGVDLPLGKHWIDVLGMLHQKTLGNLAPQEQQILEGILADLRMQYVSLTSAASSRPSGPRGFTGRDIIGGK